MDRQTSEARQQQQQQPSQRRARPQRPQQHHHQAQQAMSEPKDAARSDAALIAPNSHAARYTDNLNVVLNNQISGAGAGAAAPTASAAARPTRVVVPPTSASASVGGSTMDGSSAATESLVGISSLATERMRDGLCPTCGTRLYRLKKESKMTKIGNKLDRMSINPYKKKNRDGGTEGVPDRTAGGRDPRIDPQTKLMRMPLTIEGEVLRGQCLRCTGGESSNRGGYGDGTLLDAGLGGMAPAAVAAISSAAQQSSGRNVAATTTTTAAAAAAAEPDDGYEGIPDAVAMPVMATATPSPYDFASTSQINVEYNGQYNEAGQRHGTGSLRWENGDKYEGNFWCGMMDGEGTLYFADGTEYVGSWKLNKMDGQGTRRYANGNVYTGEYRAGKRTGQGRCYFANGDLYTGAWNHDLIEGFGRYHYNTGRAFEGNFKAGKREGRGKFQLLNGTVDIYRYVDDKRVGDGVRWSKDRTKAWRLDYKGKKRNKVTLEEAMRIADRCGPVVDYTLQPGGAVTASSPPMNPNNGTGGTMM